MSSTPTPHIAASAGDFAPVVLMPGDPLRAKFIAENYLEGTRQVTSVRNMLGYTGTFQGTPVSVMGSGMGIPSIGIYSFELFNFYGVDKIIRVGTAGGIGEGVRTRDVVIAAGACTDSNYAAQFCLPGTFAPIASYNLLSAAVDAAREQGVSAHVGNVLSSDAFYNAYPDANERWASMGVLAVEMETAGLYLNAAKAGKEALGIFTVSDIPATGESLSSEERQTTFTQMMEVALAAAVKTA